MMCATTDLRRVVVIEPDPARARQLERWLRSDAVGVEVVSTASEAVRSIAGRPVDLVMTSTFLAPSEASVLTAQVNRMRGRKPPIIDVPYFIDSASTAAGAETGRVLSFLRRNRRGIRPHCGVAVLHEQIAEYLQQAVSEPSSLVDRLDAMMFPSSSGLSLVSSRPAAPGIAQPAFGEVRSVLASRQDRRGAPRKPLTELPWLHALRIPHAADARVVDISSTGMLIETPTKIAPGSVVDVEIIGPDVDLRVPARMLRAHVADVDTRGVRYRVAAAFARYLDVPGLASGATRPVGLSTVSELLQRLLETLRGTVGTDPVARFESELRRLLPVRDIQIRRTPAVVEKGLESVYFTVPTGSPEAPILQVIFEAGHVPSAMEFRVLKAAAGLAAAVVTLSGRPVAEPRLLTA